MILRACRIPSTHFHKSILHRTVGFSTSTDQKIVNLQSDHVTPHEKATSGSAHPGPLVILHGLFGSKRNWTSLTKTFSHKLHTPVYALDLRNHGISPHARPMDYSSMAADVVHFCREHALENVSLMGHSMGGKVAMSIALQKDLPPKLLSHLIVVDIAPSKGTISPGFTSYVEAMQEIENTGVHTRKEANTILSRYEKDESIKAFLLTNLIHDAHTGRWKFRIPIDIIAEAIPRIGEFPFEPGQSSWDGKTLFIKGSRSHYINGRNTALAKQFFPRMEMKTLDTGHWVHAERPKEFIQLVTHFLSPTS